LGIGRQSPAHNSTSHSTDCRVKILRFYTEIFRVNSVSIARLPCEATLNAFI
jgi:hypothetical protein